MSSMLIALVLVQFYSTSALLVENPCQRPDGKPGNCKLIKSCSSLYRNINSLPRIETYIWHAHCGFENKHPKACCPLSSEETLPRNNVTITNITVLPGRDICGFSGAASNYYIGGGINTKVDEFPWMAVLEYQKYNSVGKKYYKLGCAGSLINNRYVVTAAHCINSDLANVRLGEWNTETDPDCDMNKCAPPFSRIAIEKSKVFESYDPEIVIKYHDIALLRLAKEVTFSDYVRPICLPSTVEDLYRSYVNTTLTVAGWGLTLEGSSSHIKLKVDVPVRSSRFCPRGVDEGHLCAGGVSAEGACSGDSGGPLATKVAYEGREQWYLLGVVSGGPDPCFQKNVPTRYTRVSKYVSWIVENLEP